MDLYEEYDELLEDDDYLDSKFVKKMKINELTEDDSIDISNLKILTSIEKACLINALIADFNDTKFFRGVIKFASDLHMNNDTDINGITELAKFILNNKKININEVLAKIVSLKFTPEVKSKIDMSPSFTKSGKRMILNKLSMAYNHKVFGQYLSNMEKNLNKAYYEAGTNEGLEAYDRFTEVSNLLNKEMVSRDISLKTMTGFSCGGDDMDENLDNVGIRAAVNGLKKASANTLLLPPPFSHLFGGGLRGSELTLICAKSGGFKTGTLHNLLFLASSYNDPSKLVLEEGMKPLLLLYELELTNEQMLLRQMQYLGNYNLNDPEYVESKSDDEIEEEIARTNASGDFKIKFIIKSKEVEDDGDANGKSATLTVEDIKSDIENYKTLGYQVVGVFIDYISLLEVSHNKYKKYNDTGGEGSALLTRLCHECRSIATKYKIPVVVPAQLNDGASVKLSEFNDKMKYVDILYHFSESDISASKAMKQELDNLIFCNRFSVTTTNTETESKETKDFISFRILKDRHNHSRYVYSKRDINNKSEYDSYTRKLQNNNMDGMRLTKETADVHFVVPVDGYKIDYTDYAKSIRMFYTDERSDFISIKDVISRIRNSENIISDEKDVIDLESL